MKKFAMFTGLMVFMVLFGTVFAAEFKTGENYNLPKSETINDNLYAFTGNGSIEGNISGDTAVFGGTLIISGNTGKDLAAAGGNISISGNAGDDIRAVGGTVVFSGKAGGEVMLAGGQLVITQDASIEKGLSVAGGTVIINGRVKGPVRIYGGEIMIGKTAVLENGLIYNSKEQAQIEAGSQIGGDVVFNPIVKKERKSRGAFGTFWFIKMLMMLALGLVLFWLFKKQTRILTETAFKGFWKNALTGFILLILLPITALILFITILGIPFAIIILLLYVLALLLASILSGIMFGTWILKKVHKEQYQFTWFSVALGIILLSLICLIPLAGWLVCLLFFLPALGMLYTIAYKNVLSWRN